MPLGRGDSVVQLLWEEYAALIFGKTKKRPKFGAIYDNFGFWLRISWKLIKILTNRKSVINNDSSRVGQKIMNFGLLTTTVSLQMFIHLRSTLRVLHHVSSGHVTLLHREIQPLKVSSNLTYGTGRLTWVLPQISSFRFTCMPSLLSFPLSPGT